MGLSETFDNIAHELSKKEPKTIIERMVKLGEEYGELCAGVLKRHGLKGAKNKTPEDIEINILEEASDMIIIIATILSEYRMDSIDVDYMIDQKLEKWMRNIDKHDSWKKDMELL